VNGTYPPFIARIAWLRLETPNVLNTADMCVLTVGSVMPSA
jgi:hypothetical protein